jgi:breast carcinoma-amplified sequence 3
MGYAERRLITSKISAGGCYFEGVPSYTATVLNAAKSLGKGLRELGEQVAAGLTGNNQMSNVTSQSSTDVNADGSQPGIVTIIDIRNPINDISPTTGTPVAVNGNDPIIAHFVAHTEAIVCLAFDPSGTLCFTADRRGHDFNIFKIHPHPSGSVLAAVHHLYVLHRGDTSAKVQDVSFSFDSRWIAVSTLRGTTHVFPITPYGGAPALRTHSQPHVVNRLSRFHRSAGLHVADNRSGSPILMAEHAPYSTTNSNPRLPPFPHPTVVNALAQLRQPCNITSTPLTSLVTQNNQNLKSKKPATEEVTNSRPLRVASIFAKSRSWLLDPPGFQQEPTIRYHRKAVDSLFVIAAHGALMQFDLEPRAASSKFNFL